MDIDFESASAGFSESKLREKMTEEDRKLERLRGENAEFWLSYKM